MNAIWAVVMMVVLAAGAAPAHAWNDTGHMTVALIAYRQLSEAERRQVEEILKAHPHYELYLASNVPDGVRVEEWAFLKAAVWADFVRPARPGREIEFYKGPEVTQYTRPAWHYINRPWVVPADRKTIDPTTMPAKPAPTTNSNEPKNVLEALPHNVKLLAAADTPPAERAVALAWLQHMVGDVHQPLHACNAYSSAFPMGDNGGNEEAVRANGNVVRLHAFWDGALGNSDAYPAIDFLARHITSDPRLAAEKLHELGEDRGYAQWVDESHRWAVALVHLNGRLRSARYAAYDARELTADMVPPLPASYESNARALSERRVATAGYRLAREIQTALRARDSAAAKP